VRRIATPREPILELADIQGNSVVPFAKPHQAHVFLRVSHVGRARHWLGTMADHVATSADVFRHNQLFRQLRAASGGAPPDLVATWQSVAISSAGLRRLVGARETDSFVDVPFGVGLAGRSGVLGDPVDPAVTGAAANWSVGGPDNEADILVVVASDKPEALEVAVRDLRSTARGVEEIVTHWGDDLVGEFQGREHFGFRDGISQPGVRGRASRTRGDYISRRLIASTDPAAHMWSRPGQPLVWPGQFVFGYPEQDPTDPLRPRPPTTRGPAWARNGSFIVVRRLRQDVAGFWRCARRHAEALRRKGVSDMTDVRLAALLVGRWPSGAPLARAPEADDSVLAADALANNHFGYAEPTVAVPTIDGYRDPFPHAVDDSAGLRCPVAAHIRKVNPRDVATEQGGSKDTLVRLILRRGIPFGEPLDGFGPIRRATPATAPADAERGLMFACYQSSIDSQFEFLQRTWSNTDDKPDVGGTDLIMGQSDRPRRSRTITLQFANGRTETVTIRSDFVIPTGGGYFFAPGIAALRQRIGS
jgi:Dyp-type peroxidase family